MSDAAATDAATDDELATLEAIYGDELRVLSRAKCDGSFFFV